MADPFVVIGSIASIIQIADVSLRLSNGLNGCVHSVRNAPKELQSFESELRFFSSTLHMFHGQSKSCLEGIKDESERRRKKEYIARVVKECNAVVSGYDALLEKFFRGFASSSPSITNIFDRLRWYMRKPLVAVLKTSLDSAKLSIIVFIVLQMYEDVQRRIHELQYAGQIIPEELLLELRSRNTQLKEQAKAKEHARRRFEAHLKATPHSSSMYFPDIQQIIDEIQAVAKEEIRSVRREGRKLRQELLSTRVSRTPRPRSPSSDSGRTMRKPNKPRPSPPVLDNAGILDAERSTSTPREFMEIPPTYRGSRRYGKSRSNILDIDEVPIIPLHPTLGPDTHRTNPKPKQKPRQKPTTHSPSIISPLNSPTPSVSAMQDISPISSTIPQDQRIYGSIIRDDGTGIREISGEWRPEASEVFRSQYQEPHQSTLRITPLASDNAQNEPRSQRRGSYTSNQSGSLEGKGFVRSEVEQIDTGKRSSEAGTSPYKAFPPFVDEDWKGVRRMPST